MQSYRMTDLMKRLKECKGKKNSIKPLLILLLDSFFLVLNPNANITDAQSDEWTDVNQCDGCLTRVSVLAFRQEVTKCPEEAP